MPLRFYLVLKQAGYALKTEGHGEPHALFPSLAEAIAHATNVAAGRPAELVVLNEDGRVSLELQL